MNAPFSNLFFPAICRPAVLAGAVLWQALSGVGWAQAPAQQGTVEIGGPSGPAPATPRPGEPVPFPAWEGVPTKTVDSGVLGGWLGPVQTFIPPPPPPVDSEAGPAGRASGGGSESSTIQVGNVSFGSGPEKPDPWKSDALKGNELPELLRVPLRPSNVAANTPSGAWTVVGLAFVGVVLALIIAQYDVRKKHRKRRHGHRRHHRPT